MTWYVGEFSLVGQEAKYAAALPELRAKVSENWYALGLLGDEESVPLLAQWLLDGGQMREQRAAIEALRLIGSPAAAIPLYGAVTRASRVVLEDLYRSLGQITDPHKLGHLASLAMTSDNGRSNAKAALVIALGRE